MQLEAPLPWEDTKNLEPSQADLDKDAEMFMAAMGKVK